VITCREYVESKDDMKVIWVHALDCLDWCLKGDYRKTRYKDPDPSTERLEGLRRDMEKHSKVAAHLSDDYDDALRKRPKVKAIRADSGEFDVELYIEGSRFPYYEYEKILIEKPVVSIVMDMSIPWGERNSDEMKRRHRKIYKIAAECEAESQPCRIIAAMATDVTEGKIYNFLVVKDYNEPMFEGVWGGLQSNKSANDFGNVIMDYLVGTHASGNGRPSQIKISEFIDPAEVVLVDPKRIEL